MGRGLGRWGVASSPAASSSAVILASTTGRCRTRNLHSARADQLMSSSLD